MQTLVALSSDLEVKRPKHQLTTVSGLSQDLSAGGITPYELSAEGTNIVLEKITGFDE